MTQNAFFAAACIAMTLAVLLCWVFDARKPRPGMVAGVILAVLGTVCLAVGAMS